MSDFVDVGALNEEQKGALRRLILRLADSKRLMGIRYSDWILGAPSLETGIATSSMTQDEWGHARLFYAMLKQLGDDPVVAEHDRAAEEYGNLGILDAPAEDWATLVSAMVIADGALSAALRGFATGTFEPAANRVPKMLSEEEFHVSLGKAWRLPTKQGRFYERPLRRICRSLWLGSVPRTAQGRSWRTPGSRPRPWTSLPISKLL